MSDTLDLAQKGISIPDLAQAALDDPAVMQQLLDGISPAAKSANVRSNSSEALQLLSRTNPQALLPHWDYFVSLLSQRQRLRPVPCHPRSGQSGARRPRRPL